MSFIVNTNVADVIKIWNQIPSFLRYLLLVAIIVGCSYLLFSRRVTFKEIQQLQKNDTALMAPYTLVNKFEKWQQIQLEINDKNLKNIDNIYTLINELNENVNKKFDYVLKDSRLRTNNDLKEKIDLLNDSYEKLLKAYAKDTTNP